MRLRRIIAFGIGILLVATAFWYSFRDTGDDPPEDMFAVADSITETVLTAINEDDYSAYSARFTADLRESIPEFVFLATNESIRSRIGQYHSKEFWKAERQDGYLLFFYRARFTAEPEVLVRMVFEDGEGGLKVAGFWLDSPRLRN